MNFYKVLNVSPNSTKEQIRKAYHGLAMKYHPDKSKDPLANEKFQEIHTAYEILYDDEKRKQYDELSESDRVQLFDLIKVYVTEINPKGSTIYNSLLKTFYKGSENDLKEDINSFNIKNIFSKIKNELIQVSEPDKDSNIYVRLKERYEGKFKYVRCEGKTYIVPIIHDTYTVQLDNNKVKTINIVLIEEPGYQIIDKYDLLCIKAISLYQYLYGGKIKINHINSENILFEFDCCLEKKPIFAIENKGLLKNDNGLRGSIYIYLTCQGINSLNDDPISKNYAKTLKETLELIN
ncbi:MAG: DnaJ domain protein [Barrevirus sp.]|uniref:DnaJ domain protein n=1 Tax=Barrevirus sp. TaxID=2487763 RepID=A0A3G4ZQU0_9VIRU|nr:MAG: DnaJ domain protein [Barrevirus sp.]